ncbi:MAG: dimethyl sulfoxide reductase anchor subunit [Hyphomicrobiaceae bacterium]|nr:dimethyl sulfoxide reductase anchor subunit [Hyphomicrobiaceae bacterium]
MHPAYSVIFFTTASGAGYGLLILLGLLGPLGWVPQTSVFGLVGLGLALTLVTGGLLSSTAHLGHPERAWRALSQWRSSWLSREGVASLATYVPAGVLGIGWVFLERTDGFFAAMGVLAAVFAVGTLVCTGMIYASLPTIRAWHQPFVVPVYVALGLATGALLLSLLLLLVGVATAWAPWLAILTLAAAWLLKTASWARADRAERIYTVEQATGLGRFGKVRPLEPPHTQPNYVMREMGYRIGRKHAQKLRRIAVMLTFVVPVLVSALMLAAGSGIGLLLALGAVVSAGAGVLLERWLFFAEAEHVVMIYYGREAA